MVVRKFPSSKQIINEYNTINPLLPRKQGKTRGAIGACPPTGGFSLNLAKRSHKHL